MPVNPDMIICVEAEPVVNLVLDLNSARLLMSPIFEVGVFIGARPAAEEVLFYYKFASDVTLHNSSCTGVSAVRASAPAIFTVWKSGVQSGTITFSELSDEPIFDLTFTSYNNGDTIEIISPLLPDATLANFGLTISGIRN